jgi:citrate lyase subunit beta/citryl-CoA lyase
MRSLLIVPADSTADFERALASAADGLVIDLACGGASGGPEILMQAREGAARMIDLAHAAGKACLAQIHPLPSGLADDDLDIIMPARPLGIVLPQAVGGRDVQHLGAKLAVREAENGFDDGYAKILALGGDSPAALFELSSFPRATRRLIGLGRDEKALAQALGVAPGAESEPLRVARSLCLFAAAAAGAPAYDCAEDSAGETFAQASAAAARDGFSGKLARTIEQVATINAAFALRN